MAVRRVHHWRQKAHPADERYPGAWRKGDVTARCPKSRSIFIWWLVLSTSNGPDKILHGWATDGAQCPSLRSEKPNSCNDGGGTPQAGPHRTKISNFGEKSWPLPNTTLTCAMVFCATLECCWCAELISYFRRPNWPMKGSRDGGRGVGSDVPTYRGPTRLLCWDTSVDSRRPNWQENSSIEEVISKLGLHKVSMFEFGSYHSPLPITTVGYDMGRWTTGDMYNPLLMLVLGT